MLVEDDKSQRERPKELHVIVSVPTTSCCLSRAASAPTSLLTVIILTCHLVSYVAQNFIPWTIETYRDFVANFSFVLYVCKGFLKELFCCRANAPAISAVSIYAGSFSDLDAEIPDIIHPRSIDASKDTCTVSDAGDRAWFLSDESFPDATQAERERFLRARKDNVPAACIMLKKYLLWRNQFDSIEDEEVVCACHSEDSEEDPDWSMACQMASSRVSSTRAPLRTTPPCILFMPDKNKDTDASQGEFRTHDGKRVLQHLPARIDLSVADGEFYATALALYIDRCVSRDSMEKICVVIDTRPGKGWR